MPRLKLTRPTVELFDLTQTRLSDFPFILRPLRGCRARRLDHLRDIWRSCVSAPVASSNTVEGQKRRSPKSASLTYSFGRRCACFYRLAVRAAGLANGR